MNDMPVNLTGAKSSVHHADIYAGRMLRDIRKNKGMTQTELGAAVGVTFQQIQKYEIGSNRMSVSRLYEIAKCLKVSPIIFFPTQEQSDA